MRLFGWLRRTPDRELRVTIDVRGPAKALRELQAQAVKTHTGFLRMTPTTLCWDGRPVRDLTREQLLEAIEELAEDLKLGRTVRVEGQFAAGFFAELRPRRRD